MKVLLVAATEMEIAPFMEHLSKNWAISGDRGFIKGEIKLQVYITGVGMIATTYSLVNALQHSYDIALQVGVAGSFNSSIKLGELVCVKSEQYGDLGAEDHYKFLDIFDLGLLQPGTEPFTVKELVMPLSSLSEKIQLQQVKGITVNTVSGSSFTIQSRMEKFAPDIESMEGIAFHYVCLKHNIPFAQVRSISNYVEPRDKTKWQMKDAIINLSKWLIDFIEKL